MQNPPLLISSLLLFWGICRLNLLGDWPFVIFSRLHKEANILSYIFLWYLIRSSAFKNEQSQTTLKTLDIVSCKVPDCFKSLQSVKTFRVLGKHWICYGCIMLFKHYQFPEYIQIKMLTVFSKSKENKTQWTSIGWIKKRLICFFGGDYSQWPSPVLK